MTPAETYTEEQGIQAIIDLQALAGKVGSKEQATKGWNSMSKYDKLNTTAAHKLFCVKAID